MPRKVKLKVKPAEAQAAEAPAAEAPAAQAAEAQAAEQEAPQEQEEAVAAQAPLEMNQDNQGSTSNLPTGMVAQHVQALNALQSSSSLSLPVAEVSLPVAQVPVAQYVQPEGSSSESSSSSSSSLSSAFMNVDQAPETQDKSFKLEG